MREDLCSIPINDVFAPKTGCPICRMRDMLEDRMATYITGAAMMEPDVREETNRLGFCHVHFEQILARGSRLSVALIQESLISEINKEVFPSGKLSSKKLLQTLKNRRENCFICSNLTKNMNNLVSNMIKLWQGEEEFRTLYSQQEFICLEHYSMVIENSVRLPKKIFAAFSSETTRLSKKYLDELQEDVTHFCRMFDYRNNGGDWGNSKDSIERTIKYLTSREPKAEQRAEEKNR